MRTGLVYGILWLSEGTCTRTWAPLLSLRSIRSRWTTGLLGIFNKTCGLCTHMEADAESNLLPSSSPVVMIPPSQTEPEAFLVWADAAQ